MTSIPARLANAEHDAPDGFVSRYLVHDGTMPFWVDPGAPLVVEVVAEDGAREHATAWPPEPVHEVYETEETAICRSRTTGVGPHVMLRSCAAVAATARVLKASVRCIVAQLWWLALEDWEGMDNGLGVAIDPITFCSGGLQHSYLVPILSLGR